ncbi:hypothetical protein GCM10011352_10150 [Marinobacterium zhoushanense]|uniref:RING-type E3 ubiquitin transferase n=1 Tax=Marinobacterium zhoushanense TaxID=1679163 RepID=A0ABQ1K6V1_9GAMM|nr:GIDE domain-containing protein [Marinobacterium zhoushanense]GGB86222.1 hypothetical protein GCM10011352_10150 [Marinobacterium zhoushanense]
MLLDLDISSNERLFSLIGCIIGFTVCIFLAFRRFTRYRLVADTPTALIRSAPQGYVELIGQVIAGEDGLLRSPLSGSPCVWYHARVERYVRNANRKGGRWKQVYRDTSSSWFQIDDGTGVCLINPAGAETDTQYKKVWYGHTEVPIGRVDSSSFHHYAASIVGGSGRYRYTEQLILEQERVYALGCFRSLGGGRERLDLKAASRDLLREWKSDQAALISRFDNDGDGKIDSEEWTRAQHAAVQQAKARQHELDALPTVDVLQNPEQQGQPFLLSTLDEEGLLTRFRWYLAGYMACALLAFWLGLEVLLTATA